MHHHVRRMPNVADHLRQPVQVMEPLAVALKGGQVLGPRRKNQQRPVCTGLKPTALWLPVSPDGVDLQVNQSQPLFSAMFFIRFSHSEMPGVTNTSPLIAAASSR